MSKYKLPLIGSKEILFSSISAEDSDRLYQSLIKSNSDPELEEYIFNKVTDNKYIDILPELEAGVVLAVLYAAFSLSGVLKSVKDFPSLIEKAREKSDNLYLMLYSKILQTMPYTLDALRQKTMSELLELFVIAENITSKPVDIIKLRELLSVPVQGKTDKKVNLTESQLASLQAVLDMEQQADLDETGRFIGDGNLL